jgi:hypothetical protein
MDNVIDYEAEVARCDAEIARYTDAMDAGVQDYLFLMGLADWHAERAWLLRLWAR